MAAVFVGVENTCAIQDFHYRKLSSTGVLKLVHRFFEYLAESILLVYDVTI